MKGSTFRLFARLYAGARWTVTAVVVASVIQSLLLLPVALLVTRVFDTQVPEGDVDGLFVSGALIFGLYVASAVVGLWTRWSVLKVTKAAIFRLRGDLLAKVYSLPRAYFDRKSLGQMQSTIVQDTERLDVLSAHGVGVFPPAIAVAFGLGIVLVVLNPLLFAALFIVVPLMFTVGRLLRGRLRERVRLWQESFDVFSSQTQLTLRAMTVVKVQNAETEELERRREEHADLARTGLDMGWLQSSYAIVQSSISALAGVVVLVLGGRAVAQGDMTIGELIAFYAILALLLRQVATLVGGIPMLMSGYEYMARLEDILSAPDHEPYTGTERIHFRGELELEDVSFGYGPEPVLQDLSLTIEPGEHAALFGPNGAGKSTLVNLLLGLYRPTSGRVLADGVPYDELDIRALRRKFGVILQDPVILPGTIADNIAYGHRDASPDDIRRAAEWSTAAAFIDRMPLGYDTPVGDEGNLLSGGQRQRVAIARALVARPSVLILDEPTTYLDDASIRALLSNLAELPGAPTVLIVSHDPEVAQTADSVHHLRDGQVMHKDALEGAA